MLDIALALSPLVTVAVGALVVLLVDLLLPARTGRIWWYIFAAVSPLLALGYTFANWHNLGPVYGGAYQADHYALAYNVILLLAAFFTVLLSVRRSEEDASGYLALILWAVMGMMVLAGAGSLMTVFLGIELFSLALYVVVGFAPANLKAREAAFKYFVLGSLASAFLLMGFAFIYGSTGAMDFAGIGAAVSKNGADLLFKAGIGLSIVGFGFKLALVPFHMWAPDAYEGAPSAVTAFMSIGTKAAAFAALVRFLVAVLPKAATAQYLQPIFILALLSMLVGSVGALQQNNLKRLLAYSGISHAGYLFMSLAGLSERSVGTGIFYLLTYLFTNMGIFAIIGWMGQNGQDGAELQGYQGLFYRKPVVATLLTFFMFSLVGIPPAAGFMGKIYLVIGAVTGGNWLLPAALIVTSGISAAAYLRVVLTMGQKAPAASVAAVPANDAALSTGAIRFTLGLALTLAAAGTLILGVLPGSVAGLTQALGLLGLQ